MRTETPRLLLQPISTDDLDDLVALHAEPEVARFMLIERTFVAKRG